YIIAYYHNGKYNHFVLEKGQAIGNNLPELGSNYIGWLVKNTDTINKTLDKNEVAGYIPEKHLVLTPTTGTISIQ
ncbi:MAG: hypothetical protein ACI4TX_04265, partial [Christensenellales bacterium]